MSSVVIMLISAKLAERKSCSLCIRGMSNFSLTELDDDFRWKLID